MKAGHNGRHFDGGQIARRRSRRLSFPLFVIPPFVIPLLVIPPFVSFAPHVTGPFVSISLSPAARSIALSFGRFALMSRCSLSRSFVNSDDTTL